MLILQFQFILTNSNLIIILHILSEPTLKLPQVLSYLSMMSIPRKLNGKQFNQCEKVLKEFYQIYSNQIKNYSNQQLSVVNLFSFAFDQKLYSDQENREKFRKANPFDKVFMYLRSHPSQVAEMTCDEISLLVKILCNSIDCLHFQQSDTRRKNLKNFLSQIWEKSKSQNLNQRLTKSYKQLVMKSCTIFHNFIPIESALQIIGEWQQLSPNTQNFCSFFNLRILGSQEYRYIRFDQMEKLLNYFNFLLFNAISQGRTNEYKIFLRFFSTFEKKLQKTQNALNYNHMLNKNLNENLIRLKTVKKSDSNILKNWMSILASKRNDLNFKAINKLLVGNIILLCQKKNLTQINNCQIVQMLRNDQPLCENAFTQIQKLSDKNIVLTFMDQVQTSKVFLTIAQQNLNLSPQSVYNLLFNRQERFWFADAFQFVLSDQVFSQKFCEFVEILKGCFGQRVQLTQNLTQLQQLYQGQIRLVQ